MSSSKKQKLLTLWKDTTLDISQHRDYWPTQNWKVKTPQETDLHPEPLTQLDSYAHDTDILRSVLIVRSGYIVFENYYHGWTQSRYQNVNSVTKSVTSALVGIALHEGYLQSLDQTLLSFFPEYTPQALDPRKQAITLRHLLSMSSGYQVPPRDVETFLEDTTSDEKMLDRPLQHNPGEAFGYDDVSCHFLSRILHRVTHMPLAHYAQTRLFEPLGIWRDEQGTLSPWAAGTRSADTPHPFALWNAQEDALWSVDPQGYHPAGLGLQLTTREMATFGYLYLNHGWWNGQAIIPENYVRDSLSQHSVTTRGEPYGYLWYVIPQWYGYTAYLAIGFGGQLIAVFPDLDTVVVTTFRPEPGPSPSRTVMNDFLIPAIIKDER